MEQRQFVVLCRDCGIVVVRATRLGDKEMDRLVAHVRSCRPHEPLPDYPGVETVVRLFEVRALEPRPN